MANNNITVNAKTDITSVGSLISAGKDATLTAGRDVNLLPGSNTAYSKFTSSKSSAGLSFSISSDGVSERMGCLRDGGRPKPGRWLFSVFGHLIMLKKALICIL